VKVWVVGSSNVNKNAFIEAKQRPGGVKLSLQRVGVSIWWQGKGGLGIGGIKKFIRALRQVDNLPDYIALTARLFTFTY